MAGRLFATLTIGLSALTAAAMAQDAAAPLDPLAAIIGVPRDGPATEGTDPPDMVALAKAAAMIAPDMIQRFGRPTFEDFPGTQWRGVRANYKRFEIVNDRVVFCGEVNGKKADGTMTGWTKFAFLPGDPPILVTDRPGLGLREVGPQVLKNVCQKGDENWLTADFTSYFARPLREGAFGF